MKNAIWRSRAAAILGFLVIVLAVFAGLPRVLKGTLFVVFGFLIMVIGLAGSRHKAYSEPIKVNKEKLSGEPVMVEVKEVMSEEVETIREALDRED